MTAHVLIVDDEPNILTAFKRQLRSYADFMTDCALSGEAALKMIETRESYAVIVTDMNMPHMNGIQLLKEVRRLSPHTVRIMLTGNADQHVAIDAINEGSIFRFLNKPCSTEHLGQAILDGAEYYRALTAEKELLQHTLGGSVKVLTEILSMVDPVGFGKRIGIREQMRKAATALGLANSWDIELAAMLASIGIVVVPTTVLLKLQREQYLLPEEAETLAKVPEVGSNLLHNIPRLESVSDIVLYQNKRYDGGGTPVGKPGGEKIPLGARVLRIVEDLVALQSQGKEQKDAFESLIQTKGLYDPKVLETIKRSFLGIAEERQPEEPRRFEIHLKDLIPGHRVVEKVETVNGLLLLSVGTEITPTALQRLQNYARFIGLKEPIVVDSLIPVKR